jgi:hypothetical protein
MALWQTAPGASPWRGCCSKEGFSPAPAARDAYVEVSHRRSAIQEEGPEEDCHTRWALSALRVIL